MSQNNEHRRISGENPTPIHDLEIWELKANLEDRVDDQNESTLYERRMLRNELTHKRRQNSDMWHKILTGAIAVATIVYASTFVYSYLYPVCSGVGG